jgi:hypothetical protein
MDKKTSSINAVSEKQIPMAEPEQEIAAFHLQQCQNLDPDSKITVSNPVIVTNNKTTTAILTLATNPTKVVPAFLEVAKANCGSTPKL